MFTKILLDKEKVPHRKHFDWHVSSIKKCMTRQKQNNISEEVIEEVASFPNGDHDDYCDSMTMAVMRFRQGGFISLDGEELDDWGPPRKREYY